MIDMNRDLVGEGDVGLGGDLIWGVSAIGREIGRNPRQTFHLLDTGRLPGKKIGGRWCASRSGLRQFFAVLINGEIA
jgi:hypothetical protein